MDFTSQPHVVVAASWCARVRSSAPSGQGCKRWSEAHLPLLTNLRKDTQEAFDLMLQHAAELGANAVVGARYDVTEIMQGVTEVLAYDRGLFVEPVK